MICDRMKTSIALYAGGDLQEPEAAELERHLAACEACREELASYQASLALTSDLAQCDPPEALPEDFADSILEVVAVTTKTAPGQGGIIRWMRRYGVATGAAAALVIISVRLYDAVTDHANEQRIARQRAAIHELISRDPSIVTLATLGSFSIEGPWRLDEWRPSGQPGIVAILHKPDAVGQPDQFMVDFITESNKIEYSGDPWKRQRINQLTLRTGSADNIYIAEYPMPNIPVARRRATARALIDQLKPYYNN